jgi:hypothetical protein
MQAKIARAIANGVQDYIEGNPGSASVTGPVPAASSVALEPTRGDETTSEMSAGAIEQQEPKL